MRNVVITGAALGTPAGYTLQENVDAWRQGQSLFSEIERFNTVGSSVRYAGQCPAPQVKNLPNRKVQKILRRKDVISLLVSLDAAKNAGIEKGGIDPERIGMYAGASCTQIGDLTPYFTLVAQCANMDDGTFDSQRFGSELMEIVNPLVVLQTLMNNGLCYGTMEMDIRGVNANFMDFQVSGLRAVGEAFRSISFDRADVVIAGGISGPVEPFQLAEGIRSGYLAKTAELDCSIGEAVRPYDQGRRGAVLSEGSAYVVLEEEQHAIKRGANILGRVRGFKLGNDGAFDMTQEHEAPGMSRAIDGALNEAKLDRRDVGMIVGHGSGSIHADKAEAKSYVDYFGGHKDHMPVTSPKSVLGDLCEAGGVLSIALALDSFEKKAVPATFNYKNGDEYSSQLNIAAEEQDLKSRRALVTSRNFMGLSAALVVEEP